MKLNATIQLYAVLSIDGQVITTGRYPKAERNHISRCLVPVPDYLDERVKPGWWYLNGKFTKEKPR